MELVKCSQCGELHDVSDIEPTLVRPDPLLDIEDSQRGKVTFESKDAAILFGPRRSLVQRLQGAPSTHRYFLRVLLPFEVQGRSIPISWGIWVEVAKRDYNRVQELWTDPMQHLEPPFRAKLANNVWGYPPTIGLEGTVQLQSPKSIPRFTLQPNDHIFAVEHRTGVSESQVLQWLDPIIHR